MGKLTASMVVDLEDRTGRKVQTIIGNLDRLSRAERNAMLANNGVRLSNRDRAMERLMMEREREMEERRAKIAMWARGGALAVGAAGIAAGAAYKSFADVERRINRIVINADKGVGAIQPTLSTLRQVADDTRLGFDEVMGGLDTLIASGRSLDEALAFLPSVAMTAQASGAAISDIALSADALAGALDIDPSNMQRAFDVLVAGGKAGKFELKDMSQYLPSLLPAFSALGYKGTEGLQKIVAMLQVMRNQAGSSSEAATYLSNVLNKMYSADTAKKFKNFGVDLPKALDKARKEGKDLFEVFLDMTQLATKGDLSKLPLLFTDAEMQKGVRALMTQRDVLRSLAQDLGSVDGTALKDFNQIAEDSAAKIQKLSNLWDKFVNQLGAGVAGVANPVLEAVTTQIDEATAQMEGLRKAGTRAEAEEERKTFLREYQEIHPKSSYREGQEAYGRELGKRGRGEVTSLFQGLNEARRIRDAQQKYLDKTTTPSTGRHNRGASGLDTMPTRYSNAIDPSGVFKDKKGARHSLYTDDVPVPEARPTPESLADERRRNAYRHGTGRQYVTDETAAKVQKSSMESNRQRMEGELKGLRFPNIWRSLFGGPSTDGSPDRAAERDAWQRQFGDVPFEGGMHRSGRGAGPAAGGDMPGIDGTTTGGIQGDSAGSREVTISGTPTVITQPSGVQQVQVTNLTRPNVTINLSAIIQQAADPQAIARQIGDAVAAEASAAQQGGGDHGY